VPNLKTRLKTAEQASSRTAERFHVWFQDSRTDLFTCDQVPHTALTETELDALPIPDGVHRIVVSYGGPRE